MAAFEFRQPHEDDLEILLWDVRQENLDELELIPGLDLRTSLKVNLFNSEEAFVGVIDGDPVCVFGVAETDEPGVGQPWMVGTSRIDKHAFDFLLASKAVCDDLLGRWRVLRNVADARNKRGLRWLKFLGFTIHPAQPMGARDLLFHVFERGA